MRPGYRKYIGNYVIRWLDLINVMIHHAAGDPPGMIEGPYRAPSSPPDTPDPTNSNPLDSKSLQRRIVSGK